MRNSIKTLLFVSAFAPVLLSVACVKYMNDANFSEIFYYGFAGLFGLSLTFVILNQLNRRGETISFAAKKVEPNDAVLFGVVFTYFMPFVSKASDITVGITLAITAAAATVLWFMSSIPPHPVLRAFKFRFYKVEAANGMVYTLISKRELLDPKDLRRVKKISSSMLMEVT